MFSLENVKKVFKYNWPDFAKKIVPKGNSKEMSETSYKNIFNGAILMILAVVVQYTLVAIFVNDLWYYGGSMLGYWLKYTIGYAAVPIAILVYNQLMKGKAHNSYVVFIIGIICAFEMVSAVYYLFDNIDIIGLFPLLFIGSLARAGLTFLGASHGVIGAFDFCQESVVAYNATNPQPAAPAASPQAPVETTPTPTPEDKKPE